MHAITSTSILTADLSGIKPQNDALALFSICIDPMEAHGNRGPLHTLTGRPDSSIGALRPLSQHHVPVVSH